MNVRRSRRGEDPVPSAAEEKGGGRRRREEEAAQPAGRTEAVCWPLWAQRSRARQNSRKEDLTLVFYVLDRIIAVYLTGCRHANSYSNGNISARWIQQSSPRTRSDPWSRYTIFTGLSNRILIFKLKEQNNIKQ